MLSRLNDHGPAGSRTHARHPLTQANRMQSHPKPMMWAHRRILGPRLAALALAAALLTLAASPAAAQQSAIQGLVTSSATGGPIQGVTVALEAGGQQVYGVLTDRNGFYQLGGITPGEYTLRATYVGYTEHEQTVTFPPGERLTITFQLEQSAIALEGVVVTAGGGAVVRDMGRQRVTPRDLRMVPVPAGSGDLASFLQTLPGVVTTGDRGGQLFVRGGTAAENLILIDGFPIYQPFHILGFFSVFPEDLVSGVDFYAGGFGARYNGRTSSVLDVQMRDGNPNGYRAMGSAGPFVAEAIVEGPLGEEVSWLVATRRSLVNETSETLLGERQPITFDSQLFKLSASDGDELRCSGLALRTSDRGQIDPEDAESHVSWGNIVAGGRCVALFETMLRLLEVNFSYTKIENSAVSRGSSRFRSLLGRFQHDAHTTNMIGTVPVYAGYHFSLEYTDMDLTELFGIARGNDAMHGLGAYVEASFTSGDRLEVMPGAVFTLLPRVSAEPRLRASWEPFGRDTEKIQGAVGLYRQDLVGTSDLRDVGSVFMAWMRAPEDVPMQSLHAMLGWQQSHGSTLSWSVEGYYKQLKDVPVPRWSAVAQFETDLTRANGTVYGVDTRAELNLPRFYGFIGYGYSWIQYEAAQREFGSWFGEPIQNYHPPHDRRHQVNAVGSLQLAGFDISARWQLGSGLPYTRPLGFDEAFDYAYDLHDVSERLGTPRLVVDRPYTGRMPIMHRLDVSVSRGFDVPLVRLELQGITLNTYDRQNMFYYDPFTARRVGQLLLARTRR